MDLLLLNAFKGLRKKKIQMLGIIIMVALSTGIYTTMNCAIDRMEDRYYNYLVENKVEHISLEPVINYEQDIDTSYLTDLRLTKLQNVTAAENDVLDKYAACKEYKTDICNDKLYKKIDIIFKKYGSYELIGNKNMAKLANKYNFTYELEHTKILTENNYTINIMPYNSYQDKINLPYIKEGHFPSKSGEITVLPKFASANNLKIGDSYKVGSKEYKIVGFTYASDYIYPMLSMNQPIFDEKYNNIIFMTPSDYEVVNGISNDSYALLFNSNFKHQDRLKISTMQGSDKTKTLANINKDGDSVGLINYMLKNDHDKISMSMNSMIRIMRTDSIQLEFATDRTFALYFLYLLLGISVFIIIVITKKRIDDERLQIGVLKSLGYKRASIAFSYLVYPIVGSLIGGLLGYILGVILHDPLTNFYMNYFTVPLAGFKIEIKYFLNSIFIPMIILGFLSYIIAFVMLRKKPLELLKEGSNLHVNFVSKLTTKLTSFMSFTSRFRYSLASRSIGKLLIVTLTSFCTGLLITLIIIGMNLFNDMIDKTFNSFNYKYMVSYNNIRHGSNSVDDLILASKMKLVSIKDVNNHKKSLKDKDYNINISGIDSYAKYIFVKDKDNNNLIPKLYEENNSIIINENISKYMNISLGDTLTLAINNTSIEYKVVGISAEYLNATAYVNREELSEKLATGGLSYNVAYSNNHKYQNMKHMESSEVEQISSVFSLKDLRRNIEKGMQTMNSSIYIVIFFASFMVLIIVAVIGNIVVEENKKTISLMKVMGYKNKEISSIVINIYTPFVIIAYLLSIPVMITILKTIVNLLIKDTKMVIPITMSWLQIIIGLVGLLIAYYIAITISKRALNKVPLAVALKRE